MLQWAKRIGSPGSYIQSYHVQVDSYGNVYCVGNFGFVTDFDPGPGTFTLVPGSTNQNTFILKLDANGNFLWAKNLEIPNCAVAMKNDHIYLAGGLQDTVDMDPGPGVYTLSGGGIDYCDAFLLELDGNGNLLWVKKFTGTHSIFPTSLTFDAPGNLYMLGWFMGTADLDPGLGVYNLTNAQVFEQGFVVKLDQAASFVWAINCGGPPPYTILNNFIKADSKENVYIAGRLEGTMDVDPGPGKFKLSAVGGSDGYCTKYDRNGNLLWGVSVGGRGFDTFYEFDIDSAGSVFISGCIEDTVDMDSGPLTDTFISKGNNDGIVLKLDRDGNYIWTKQIGNTNNDATGGIIADAAGRLIVMGGTYNKSLDLDPGPGVYATNPPGPGGVFMEQIDSHGNFTCGGVMGDSISFCDVNDFEKDAYGNYYLTGEFVISANFSMGPTPYYLSVPGSVNGFVAKYGMCGSIATDVSSYQEDQNSLFVSPNPSTGRFMVKRSGAERGEIRTIAGEKVLDIEMRSPEEEVSVDAAGLSKGLYFLQVSGSHFSETRKLVIE